MAATSTIVSGRTAVITGAGSGIGRALAHRLAAHGCPVALCDTDEEGLGETAAAIAGPVFTRRLDVRDRQGQMTFAAEAGAWAPAPFGMVVNNAGVTVSQTVAGASPEDDEWCFDVNFWGVVHGTRAWLPVLSGQGEGAIVNVSSVFGIFGYPTQSAYCASKFAVRGFTESLRHELRGTRVRAVTVHPGGVRTRIVENARFHVDDQGGTDHAALSADFARLARTSPEKAAEIIHRGVERGKDRILVGPDAVAMTALTRLMPVRHYGLLERFGDLVR